jgi:hypothetical protein
MNKEGICDGRGNARNLIIKTRLFRENNGNNIN